LERGSRAGPNTELKNQKRLLEKLKKMARKKSATKRELLPDLKSGSLLVTRFMNNLMHQGKKSTTQRIFYNAMEIIAKKANQPGLEVFQKAVENVKPVLEVKPRRVGGATYQVPVEVRSERKTALAIKWIISYARSRSEKTMADKLAAELIAASKNEGSSVKKKEDTHKMAEANRAFAHFRW
jgi:small subunit ribosomal protein S7